MVISDSDGKVLFLTSKVRLHCDRKDACRDRQVPAAFPDLKGQAPLRLLLEQIRQHTETTFPDLKGQAPLRRGVDDGPA